MQASSSFLGELAPAHAERLQRYAHEVTFAAGRPIFKEGQRADRIWVLHSGRVGLSCMFPAGVRRSSRC
ncbi:hypothetical protein ACFQZC_37805 [Streptacidiphilus monticola]